MWYNINNGETIERAKALTVNDIQYPSDVFRLWSEEELNTIGIYRVVDNYPTHDVATQYIVAGDIVLVDGVPTKQYTVVDYTAEELQAKQAEAIATMVQHFTDVATAYIEGKVQEYNKANGLAFKDIDAFTKYAVNDQSVHFTIANRFIAYADKVWTAVRNYQSTSTAVPTEEEFKAVLDSVVF